jgi:hypothetical protein
MNCSHIQELIGLYRDLPEHDLRRVAVDEHIRRCPACAEEFKLWEESYRLISQVGMNLDEPAIPRRSIAASVMDRIYMDESWRLPVAERAYSLTKSMKYRISAVIGFCLALFISSFIYSLMTDDGQSHEAYAFRPGIVPVISASGDNPTQLAMFSQEIPTASISAPFVLDIGPVDSYPDYLIVVSIIGIVCSLLIMNWLSRLRA